MKNSQIRRRAKAILRGHWPLIVGAQVLVGMLYLLGAVVFYFIFSVIFLGYSSLEYGREDLRLYHMAQNPAFFSLGGICLVLSLLLLLLFSCIASFAFLCLIQELMLRGEARFDLLRFAKRRQQFKTFLFYQLLTLVIYFLVELPYIIVSVRYGLRSFNTMMVSNLTTIFSSVIFFLLSMAVPMMMFQTGERAMDILKKSIQVFHGYKWKFFRLEMSFFLWILLSVLSCGLLILYVGPYMETCRFLFYLDIMQKRGGDPAFRGRVAPILGLSSGESSDVSSKDGMPSFSQEKKDAEARRASFEEACRRVPPEVETGSSALGAGETLGRIAPLRMTPEELERARQEDAERARKGLPPVERRPEDYVNGVKRERTHSPETQSLPGTEKTEEAAETSTVVAAETENGGNSLQSTPSGKRKPWEKALVTPEDDPLTAGKSETEAGKTASAEAEEKRLGEGSGYLGEMDERSYIQWKLSHPEIFPNFVREHKARMQAEAEGLSPENSAVEKGISPEKDAEEGNGERKTTLLNGEELQERGE